MYSYIYIHPKFLVMYIKFFLCAKSISSKCMKNDLLKCINYICSNFDMQFKFIKVINHKEKLLKNIYYRRKSSGSIFLLKISNRVLPYGRIRGWIWLKHPDPVILSAQNTGFNQRVRNYWRIESGPGFSFLQGQIRIWKC